MLASTITVDAGQDTSLAAVLSHPGLRHTAGVAFNLPEAEVTSDQAHTLAYRTWLSMKNPDLRLPHGEVQKSQDKKRVAALFKVAAKAHASWLFGWCCVLLAFPFFIFFFFFFGLTLLCFILLIFFFWLFARVSHLIVEVRNAICTLR